MIYKRDEAHQHIIKHFFQEKGTLKIKQSNEICNKQTEVEIKKLKLVEVDIDEENNSTKVTDGECIEVESIYWDTMYLDKYKVKNNKVKSY